ncbi:MAG: hypothetical protein JSW58_07925 [Candidatus Latescibacterota bacterium]|nr:MAG: hypothetical protein JSW58_07925 [Candidatus Latescibacterota bacterium]
MRYLLSVALVMVGLLWSCGDYEPPKGANEIIGTSDEKVTVPETPTGNVFVDVGESMMVTTGGATSSRGHLVEYRFDFDADGEHDYSAWGIDARVEKAWTSAGIKGVKAQARCSRHPNVTSKWSDGLTVMVGQGPETELIQVLNFYKVGQNEFTDEIDFLDDIPDTVPYGSWITIFYRGIDTTQASSQCSDPVNKCLSYQKSYVRDSDRVPGSHAQTPWMPADPEDNNPFGANDSTSMNIGSVEYTIRARAVDFYGRVDPTPAEIPIIGNFDPTLDSFTIKNHSGESIGDGETLVWDWWEPVDSGLVVIGSELKKTKTFYFVIEATGHDHPKEREGSGVYSWFYQFANVGIPGTQKFARSENWVDGIMVNALSDTFEWVAVYPSDDMNGDEVFVNNPPEWNDKSYDFSVMGRDLPSNEVFDQYVFVNGQRQPINSYSAAQLGRWTSPDGSRFHIVLRR